MINENAIALIYRDILGVDVTVEKIDKTDSTEDPKETGINEYLSEMMEIWKNRYYNQEQLYDTFGIDVLSYNEDIYYFFRKTVFSFFGNEGIVDLFQWYCTDRNSCLDDEEEVEGTKMYDADDELRDCYTLHLWDTELTKTQRSPTTSEYFKESNNTFAKLFGKHM